MLAIKTGLVTDCMLKYGPMLKLKVVLAADDEFLAETVVVGYGNVGKRASVVIVENTAAFTSGPVTPNVAVGNGNLHGDLPLPGASGLYGSCHPERNLQV